MDKIDIELIRLLSENARMPLNQLAQKVFLSSPAVASRIEKLEREGIIRKYTLVIDHVKLGYPLTAFINLELQPRQKPAFSTFIKDCHNVLECNCITGNYSMMVKVVFSSTQELDTFIGQLQAYGQTQTQIVFSTPVESREIRLKQAE